MTAFAAIVRIKQQSALLLLLLLLLLQMCDSARGSYRSYTSYRSYRSYTSYRSYYYYGYYYSYSYISIGTIVGMAIGGLFLLGFIIAGIIFCCCFLKAANRRHGTAGTVVTQPAVTVTMASPYTVTDANRNDCNKGNVPPPYAAAAASATADGNGCYVGPAAAAGNVDAQPPPCPAYPVANGDATNTTPYPAYPVATGDATNTTPYPAA